MKRMLMVAGALACGLSAWADVPVCSWFTATPGNLGGGSWNPAPSGTNTSGTAYWEIETDDPGEDDALFTAPTIEENGMTTHVSSTLCFGTPYRNGSYPEPGDDVQAGVIVGLDGDGKTNYYGLVAADGTPNYAWTKLTGANPPEDLDTAVTVKVHVNYGASPVTVSYQVGETLLSDGTSATLTRRSGSQTKISVVGYAGCGKVQTIAGNVDAAAAIGETPYLTFAQALANNSGTIKLYKDATGVTISNAGTYSINKNNFQFSASAGVAGFWKSTTADQTVTCCLRTAQTFGGGAGTAANPYMISAAVDFQEFSYWANNNADTAGKVYRLGADFDLTQIDDVALPLFPSWNAAQFAGTFDGNNRTVKYELAPAIDDNRDGYGLFGASTNATFRNLVVEGKLSGGDSGNCAAIVLGFGYGNATFENVTSKGSVTNQYNASGMVAFWKPRTATDALTFTACTNEAAIVTGYTKAGGMVSYTGSNDGNVGITFTDCLNKGYVAVDRTLTDNHASYDAKEAFAGGLIAYDGNSAGITMTNCRNEGAVLARIGIAGTSGVVGAGGFIGNCSKPVTMTGCSNAAAIAGSADQVAETPTSSKGSIGGLAGSVTGSSFALTDCSNSGTVAREGEVIVPYAYLGGFAGNASAVTFDGANSFSGALTSAEGNPGYSLAGHVGGTVAFDADATFTVPAAYKTIQDDKAVDGLIFATVSGDAATLVKNADVAAGGSYKIMAAGAPSLTLADPEQGKMATLTLATNFYNYAGTVTGTLYEFKPSAGSAEKTAVYTSAYKPNTFEVSDGETTEGKIVVDNDTLTALNGGTMPDLSDDAKKTEMQNKLNATGGNGAKVWESYAMGLESTNAVPTMAATQDTDKDNLNVSLVGLAPKVSQGSTVTYRVSGIDGVFTEPNFTIPLNKAGTAAQMIKTITIKVTPSEVQ